jgi:hypothetical protein
MMTNFGFQPGILDYWMLLTDWHNGSFAILLALGILLAGLALRNKTVAVDALSPVEGISRRELFPLPRPGQPGRSPWPATTGALRGFGR